ncbi:MAG: MFS transporter [Cryobacterium sp.]|nr:MFS transporter [Oligoflexia bacterium]
MSIIAPKATRSNALNSTVIRLGIVSFFADISSEMLYPITPLFLTSVLGASMLSVGLIEGFAECVASLLKVYAGARSDRIQKRRPFIIAGYLLAAIAKPIIGFSHSWSTVFIARGLDRTGKGVRTAPRDALLSDSVSDGSQGEAFGWHRMMDTMGAALGPLLAILFLSYEPHQMRKLYFLALIPGLFAALVAVSVRESKRKIVSQLRSLSPFSPKEMSPNFKLYLLSWGVFSLVNSSDVFLLLKAKNQGISLKVTILMYCFYNLVYALASPYLGRLSDRWNRKSLLIVGLVVFAGVYLGFSSAFEIWHYWVLFGIYGLYMACTDGVGKALVVDLSPADRKATALGILGTVSGIATLIASSVAGLLWDRVDPSAPFIYGAVGATAAALILSLLRQ